MTQFDLGPRVLERIYRARSDLIREHGPNADRLLNQVVMHPGQYEELVKYVSHANTPDWAKNSVDIKYNEGWTTILGMVYVPDEAVFRRTQIILRGEIEA